MDIKTKNTNTTEVSAVLSHDDIVSLLGLAVKMKAGIASDAVGVSVSVKLVSGSADDAFEAEVDVLVDHNAALSSIAPVVSPDAAPVVSAAAAMASPAAALGAPVSSGIIIPTA